jgi:outer membrane receptor protein involved in Fe transport
MTTSELSDFDPGNTISQQLDALPQFFDTRTLQDTGSPSNSNRSASGLNLRNLGPNRTLVLLDGSRFAPTEKQGTVNVDILPTALVRSVDIVTGGASAAYGADAVGGVVNFVLDREFEGLTVKVGTGMHERNNGGEQWQLEVAGGQSFLDGRLHLIGSAQQRLQDQIDGTATVDGFQRWGHVTCAQYQVDRTGPRRCTLPNVVSTRSSPTGLIGAPGTPIDRKQFNLDGTEIVDFILGDVAAIPGTSGGTNSMSGGPEGDVGYRAFNTSPSTSQAIARSFFVGAQYDVTDRLVVKFDAVAGRTEANAIGTGIRNGDAVFELAGNWRASVAVDNAYLPENVRQTMIDNGLDEILLHKLGTFEDRGAEGFNQDSRNVTTQEQWGVGFNYALSGLEWELEGRFQSADVMRSRQSYNRIAVDRMYLAMDAVRHPDTGAIVCRVQLPQYSPTVEQLRASPSIVGRDSSVPLDPFVPTGQAGNTKPLESPIGLDNTIRDCVPYNVMGAGNITAEGLEYISRDKFGTGFVQQDFAELVLTGDLMQLPAGPVNFAAGVTWRDQEFSDKPTAGAGVGVGGKVVTNEELGPALNDPALGIRGISPGYSGGSPNLSHFITIPNIAGAQSVTEWYAEVNVPVMETTVGDWQQSLVANLAYRQSDYERSGKSDSWKVGLDYQFNDDLRFRFTASQDVREPTFTELFDARGGGATVRDPLFDDASFQISIFRGGNLNLTPETARTDTIGLVWQPSFTPLLDGLQVSVDYWDTEVEDQVGELRTQRYVDECANNGLLCAQVTRDPVTGFITRVLRQYVNLAEATATGIDFEVSWQIEPDFFANEFETFSLRWLASDLRERSDTPLGGQPFDIAGEHESPDFTGVLTANYGIGPWSVQLQNRFVDTTLYDAGWTEGKDVDDNTIDSMSWWNGRISYQGEMSNGATWDVGLNVQNLLDESQPVVPGFSTRGRTQVFSSQFDRFGRRYNLNLNMTF